MLPGILTQLGPEGLNHLKRLANDVVCNEKLLNEEDDVPELVENFEEVADKEATVEDVTKKTEQVSVS
uniref:Uncharacterized protein n=2 Tax=Lutzomyia longipalpis TaxID=7200 RepID=A0A1B0C9U3_LUTLO